MTNFSIMCRVCFEPKNEGRKTMADTFFVNGANVCISSALSEMFPILIEVPRINMDDFCLPRKICDMCLYNLQISYTFWQLCGDSENKINEILKEHTRTEENLSSSSKHSENKLYECLYFRNLRNDLDNTYDSDIREKITIEEIVHANLDLGSEVMIEVPLGGCLKIPVDDSDVNDQHGLDDRDRKDVFFEYLGLKAYDSIQELSEEVSSQENSRKQFNFDSSKMLSTFNLMQVELEHNYHTLEYRCGICKDTLSTHGEWKIHINGHLSDSKHECLKCGSQFWSTTKFERHVSSKHEGYRPYQCAFCDMSYKSRSTLLKHLRIKHRKKVNGKSGKFKCLICNKVLTKQVYLDNHMKEHIEEKAVEEKHKNIVQIDETLKNGSLRWSMERKYEEPAFLDCEICTAQFSNSSSLMKHMKTHEGYKPLKCTVCSEFYPTVQHLKQHFQFQHQLTSYICELCDKTYIEESDLITHVRLHTGDTVL